MAQVRIDGGQRHGASSAERAEIKDLKAKVRRLEEDDEILPRGPPVAGNVTLERRLRGSGGLAMASVSVRYIVHDVDAAISFYCQRLGFHEDMHPAPTFAMLSCGELRLVLSAPSTLSGGGQAMPDGSIPQPGGWNRFSLQVDDLDAVVVSLRQHGVHFRNEIVSGVGGRQVLIDDPSGNPVELFEPTIDEARLTGP